MSEKTCFVIAPIGEDGSDTRRRSDQVLRHIISPAVKECGYATPIRADHLPKPGMITSQVIQHIIDDHLVIADLSERNPNVFYELALRHAIRKPLIQIIRKTDEIPFDVAGMRTIEFNLQDPDSVEQARQAVIDQIKDLELHPENIETPVSQSIDLKELRASDKPTDRSLADILAAIVELKAEISDVQKRLPLTDRPSNVGIPTVRLQGLILGETARLLDQLYSALLMSRLPTLSEALRGASVVTHSGRTLLFEFRPEARGNFQALSEPPGSEIASQVTENLKINLRI